MQADGTDLSDVVAAEVQAHQGGVSWTSQHGVAERAHAVRGQIEVGRVQWDGDGHGGAGSQPSTVHPGQAEAVEQAEAFHLAVASRVAVLHSAALYGRQQQQAKPQGERHYALEAKQDNYVFNLFIHATPTEGEECLV